MAFLSTTISLHLVYTLLIVKAHNTWKNELFRYLVYLLNNEWLDEYECVCSRQHKHVVHIFYYRIRLKNIQSHILWLGINLLHKVYPNIPYNYYKDGGLHCFMIGKHDQTSIVINPWVVIFWYFLYTWWISMYLSSF